MRSYEERTITILHKAFFFTSTFQIMWQGANDSHLSLLNKQEILPEVKKSLNLL